MCCRQGLSVDKRNGVESPRGQAPRSFRQNLYSSLPARARARHTHTRTHNPTPRHALVEHNRLGDEQARKGHYHDEARCADDAARLFNGQAHAGAVAPPQLAKLYHARDEEDVKVQGQTNENA